MEYILIYRQPAEIYEINRDPIKGPPNLAVWQQYLDAMGGAGILRGDPAQGMELLDAIQTSGVTGHQPWWAARASLLVMMGRKGEAETAYIRAIALTRNEVVQTWLKRKCEQFSLSNSNKQI